MPKHFLAFVYHSSDWMADFRMAEKFKWPPFLRKEQYLLRSLRNRQMRNRLKVNLRIFACKPRVHFAWPLCNNGLTTRPGWEAARSLDLQQTVYKQI